MELEEALQALEQANAEVEKQKSINKEVIATRDDIKHKYAEATTKLTTYEEQVTKTAAELEQERNKATDIAALYTAQVKTTAVRQALEKEGVTAIDTALKLIPLTDITVDDTFAINSDTVTAVVTKLKETDSVLFSKPAVKVPEPKRAAEGEPKAGFAEEIKKCKTAAEVENLLRKYGKVA